MLVSTATRRAPRAPEATAPLRRAEAGPTAGGATRLSPGAFRSMLQSERACLERHGRCFSVVTFERSGEGVTRADLIAFERRASGLLRSTDLVALTTPDEVSVLLPWAEDREAEAVARMLVEAAGEEAPGLAWRTRCHLPSPVPLEHGRRASSRVADPLPDGIRWERSGVALLLTRPLPRWKRALDVLLAGTALLVVGPLMLLVALTSKLLYGGPVIYSQWRTGQGFRRFRIFKFRTMEKATWDKVRHLNEMSGPLFKSSRDPRVLGLFARLLRKTSMDELPQLWNVLRGDMTLVGPRALSPEPREYATWQLRRFDLRAGVACLWQAERRGDTDFDEWMRSDLRYARREASLFGDLRILVRTVGAVLRCAGGR